MPDVAGASLRRGAGLAGLLLASGLVLGGCSLFDGDDDEDSQAVSVFELEPGMCFQTIDQPVAELDSLDRVDCAVEHTQEVIGGVDYPADDDPDSSDPFPGEDAVDAFAQGACAEQFQTYVGISYLDSPSLFVTYLLPSARSWEDDDRTVVCFVTSPGAPLTGSVKDTGETTAPAGTATPTPTPTPTPAP